nr:PREDICTED: protein CURVATURE THYLAKOID 1A, chloroplastic-like [Daucus carota subsp. sativus]
MKIIKTATNTPQDSTATSLFGVSRIPSRFQTKASSTDESTDNGEVFTDLKEKWDAVENKSTVLLYGGGALLGVWISSILVGAINSVPLYKRRVAAIM